jgi:hypothetical protein
MRRKQYEPKSSVNSDKNRVRENSGTLNLPRFDSIPATAGLTTTEAFQLSIRHALALLPALSQDAFFRARPSNTERFVLR